MMARIPKAIGDIIPITLVRDFCKTVVNNNPNNNIKKTTPAEIIVPNRI